MKRAEEVCSLLRPGQLHNETVGAFSPWMPGWLRAGMLGMFRDSHGASIPVASGACSRPCSLAGHMQKRYVLP